MRARRECGSADDGHHAVRYGAAPLSLLLIDIDRSKTRHDRFGHPAGDEVLSTVARLLHRSARGTDFVARDGR